MAAGAVYAALSLWQKSEGLTSCVAVLLLYKRVSNPAYSTPIETMGVQQNRMGGPLALPPWLFSSCGAEKNSSCLETFTRTTPILQLP